MFLHYPVNHCQACAAICVMEEARSNNIERDSCHRNRSTNAETVFNSEYFYSVDELALCLLECLPDRRLTLCPFTTDNAVVYLLCAMLLVSGFEAPRHAKCD